MKNYHSAQKKKTRGWRRRIRQIDRWGENIKEPYLNYFIANSNAHTYDKCYLSPFYTLDKRHPPLWFYKLILSKFIAAYFEWEKTFDKTGLPYDLQLWLYDPAYILSEIICYRMNEEGERKRFVWESELEKPFPYDKFASSLYNLDRFEWALADDADVVFDDELDPNEITAEQLIAQGFIKKVQNSNEVYYSKRMGDIWIGRLKSKTTSFSKNIVQPYYAPPKFLSREFDDEKELKISQQAENDVENGKLTTFTNHREILER